MTAVTLFYQKVLADERTGRFFENMDMDAQIQKQVAFMTRAFGGPKEYAGKPLGPAHARLVREEGLNGTHFDAIAELLGQTLEEIGVKAELTSEVLDLVGSLRSEVLGTGGTKEA